MVSSAVHNQVFARTQNILNRINGLTIGAQDSYTNSVLSEAESGTTTKVWPVTSQQQSYSSQSSPRQQPDQYQPPASTTTSSASGAARLSESSYHTSTTEYTPSATTETSRTEQLQPQQRQQQQQPPPLPIMATSSTQQSSPFSQPITSLNPPRPVQILLVNPTSTPTLSGTILSTLRPILPQLLEITAYTAPFPSPTAIESATDAVLSSETAVRDLAKHSTNNGETVLNFDGLLVASFGHHPIIDMLRESYDVPVIGVMEASLYVARMLGGRFGIIVTGGANGGNKPAPRTNGVTAGVPIGSRTNRLKVQVEDAIRGAYGLSAWCVGVESLGVTALQLLDYSVAPMTTATATGTATAAATTTTASSPSSNAPTANIVESSRRASSMARGKQLSQPPLQSLPQAQAQLQQVQSSSQPDIPSLLRRASHALLDSGADTIILGSEHLCSPDLIRLVKDAVRDPDSGRRLVNVIDCVEAGVMVLHGLVGMGVPMSKRGLFESEREGRRARGQNWL